MISLGSRVSISRGFHLNVELNQLVRSGSDVISPVFHHAFQYANELILMSDSDTSGRYFVIGVSGMCSLRGMSLSHMLLLGIDSQLIYKYVRNVFPMLIYSFRRTFEQ